MSKDKFRPIANVETSLHDTVRDRWEEVPTQAACVSTARKVPRRSIVLAARDVGAPPGSVPVSRAPHRVPLEHWVISYPG